MNQQWIHLGSLASTRARVLSQWDSVIEDDDDPGDKNPFAFDVDEEEEDEDEEDSSVIDERRKEN